MHVDEHCHLSVCVLECEPPLLPHQSALYPNEEEKTPNKQLIIYAAYRYIHIVNLITSILSYNYSMMLVVYGCCCYCYRCYYFTFFPVNTASYIFTIFFPLSFVYTIHSVNARYFVVPISHGTIRSIIYISGNKFVFIPLNGQINTFTLNFVIYFGAGHFLFILVWFCFVHCFCVSVYAFECISYTQKLILLYIIYI